MSEPFLGQLMLVSFNFAPTGYAMANGQLVQISQNQALFSLLGTTFGGDGTHTFGLPNLQGRVAVHQGSGFTMGQKGGEEMHTMIGTETPTHTHLVTAINTASAIDPAGAFLGGGGPAAFNSLPTSNPGNMNLASIGSAGGSQPHENRQPYLVMNWLIAVSGIFPTQN